MAKTKSTPKISKRLNEQQRKIFVAKGFTKALLNAIISDGWDKRDIDDYILRYNHNNNKKIPIPTLTNGMLQEIERRKRANLRAVGRASTGTLSEVHGPADKEIAISALDQGNCPGYQDRFTVPVICPHGTTRSIGSLLGRII